MWLDERIAAKVRPCKDNVIICLEDAADFHHLSNGGSCDCPTKVYSKTSQEIEGLDVIVLPNCFQKKQYEERNGVFVTTKEQTLLDLLEYENIVDIQCLLESWSNYYYSNHESFNGLEEKLNEVQKVAFEKWKQDMIDYYTEE